MCSAWYDCVTSRDLEKSSSLGPERSPAPALLGGFAFLNFIVPHGNVHFEGRMENWCFSFIMTELVRREVELRTSNLSLILVLI